MLQVHVHGQNLSSVYDKIDQCMLPEEYLPDDYTGAHAGTIQDICSKLKCFNSSHSTAFIYLHLAWYKILDPI